MITHRSQPKASTTRRTISLLSAIAVTVTASLFPAPAQAYYYPFNYYGGRGVGNLLYPLSYLAYPLLGGRAPYSAYSAPYLMRQASRTLTGSYNYPYGPYANSFTGYPNMDGPYGMQSYTDQEPLNSPRQRQRPKRKGQYGVDETAHAEWLDPAASDAALMQNMPPAAASQYGNLQNQIAGQIPPPNATTAGAPPPLAPNVVGSSPITLAPNRNNANPGAPVGAPLAEGFINHVNSKYSGDIKSALFDPETRSYARVIGLVSDDNLFQANLSDARVALVKQILQDSSLDPVSKLQAIKIMIGGNR